MSYQKIHLKLHKNDFKPAADLLPIEEEVASYDRFIGLMTRVGEPSNWDKRIDYHNPKSIQKLEERLNEHSSHLWVFKDNKKDVGFCQTVNVENLTELFNRASGITEIYKVGLFPEHVGHGLGKGYVSSVINEIFKTAHTVYLNTRDTNVINSVPFYQKLGFQVFKTETLPDDLHI